MLRGIGDFIAQFKGESAGHPFRGNQWSDGNSGAAETVDRYVRASSSERRTMQHKGEIQTDVGGGVTGNFYQVGDKIVAHDTWGVDHAEGLVKKHEALDHQFVIGRTLHVIGERPYLVSDKLDKVKTVFDTDKLPTELKNYISDFEKKGGSVGEGKYTYGYDKENRPKIIDVSEWRLPKH